MICLKQILTFQYPVPWHKRLYEIKKLKNKNNKLIEANKNKRSDLSDKINEQPDKLLEVVKEILDFNEEIKKQRGQGPRILTKQLYKSLIDNI